MDTDVPEKVSKGPYRHSYICLRDDASLGKHVASVGSTSRHSRLANTARRKRKEGRGLSLCRHVHTFSLLSVSMMSSCVRIRMRTPSALRNCCQVMRSRKCFSPSERQFGEPPPPPKKIGGFCNLVVSRCGIPPSQEGYGCRSIGIPQVSARRGRNRFEPKQRMRSTASSAWS